MEWIAWLCWYRDNFFFSINWFQARRNTYLLKSIVILTTVFVCGAAVQLCILYGDDTQFLFWKKKILVSLWRNVLKCNSWVYFICPNSVAASCSCWESNSCVMGGKWSLICSKFTQTFGTHLSASINQKYLNNITIFMEQKILCSKEENRKNLGTRRKVLKLKFQCTVRKIALCPYFGK